MSNPMHDFMNDFTRDERLRLQCLALTRGDVHAAHAAYEFAIGRSDLTPRQRIDAALKEIEAANAKRS